jgi:nucleoside-diphosphate-sugar epimerase
MANATGTLNLLEAAREAGVRRFVYAGSSSAYGNTVELPKREAMPSMPLSPYAVAKLAGEHYVKIYHQVYGMETAAFRYFNVFGPGQDPDSGYAAVIPRFVTMALRDEAPTIFGDGEQTRDFTYIDNVVKANLTVAEAPAEAISGQVFNLGCGDRISLNRLWSEIKDLTGTDVDVNYGPRRAGDVQDSLADISRLTEATGFVPEIDLREGLRRTVEFFRAPVEAAAQAHPRS